MGHQLGREHDSTSQSGVEAPRLLKRSLPRLYYCGCCCVLLCVDVCCCVVVVLLCVDVCCCCVLLLCVVVVCCRCVSLCCRCVLLFCRCCFVVVWCGVVWCGGGGGGCVCVWWWWCGREEEEEGREGERGGGSASRVCVLRVLMHGYVSVSVCIPIPILRVLRWLLRLRASSFPSVKPANQAFSSQDAPLA